MGARMSLKKQLKGSIRSGDNQKVSDVLEQMNAEVNEKGKYGFTALHEACLWENNRAVSLLLAKPGINVNVKDNLGQTLLHVAGRRNNHLVVNQLLGCPGIDENARDNNGRTPIMAAARVCSEEALGVMLEAPRVDLDVKDNDGRGLEENVGLGPWARIDKKKCVDMIKGERMNRKNVLENEKQIRGKLEAARETLECPVCLETMKPPTRIWMCRSTHAICEACKDQLIRVNGGPHPLCPMCKSERVNQRAIIAEKFAQSVFNT